MDRSGVALTDLQVSAAPVTGRLTVRTAQAAVMVAVLPLAGSAIWLALASDHVERPVPTALYRATSLPRRCSSACTGGCVVPPAASARCS
jgi:hypothetical protein